MDLTFQVPMQYCSLQHWILLLSPVTSTAGYCFCFGSISSILSGVICPLIFKSRDITLLTKVRLVKAMVFPVVMYGCKSWTVKKAECHRIDAFELWCWKRLLRVPWTARRSNQCVLKDISPEYSLERLMLKLKLQYFGHLMRRAGSLKRS